MQVYRALLTNQCEVTPSRFGTGRAVVKRELHSLAEAVGRRPVLLRVFAGIGVSVAHLENMARNGAPAAALPIDASALLDSEVIDNAEIARLGEVGLFSAFFARYPSASSLVSFSRVVFNDDRTEALVGCGRAYGSLAGESYLVSLVRSGTGWVVAGSRLTGQA